MKKGAQIFITILLIAILACTIILVIMVNRGPKKPPETAADNKIVIKFDTGDGQYFYPLEYSAEHPFDSLNEFCFYVPHKPDSVFVGWYYKDKYIFEYDAETFKTAGEYVFVAKWEKADTVEDEKIKALVVDNFFDSSFVNVTRGRGGYNVTLNADRTEFKNWYDCGIYAIECIGKLQKSEDSGLIKRIEICFMADSNCAYFASFDNTGAINKLTDFSDMCGNAVSLMTEAEYAAVKAATEKN